MAKIKAVLPSLREKKRYLAFEVISRSKASRNAVSEAVLKQMLAFNGELGTAQAGIQFPKINKKTQKGIIRVSHRHVDNLKAALTMIKEIENRPAIVKSIKSSGAINKVEKLIAG